MEAEARRNEALIAVAAALDLLQVCDLDPANPAAAKALVQHVEALGTRIDAVRTAVVGALIDSGMHTVDAFTPKTFVAHHARTNSAEASARVRTTKALRELPLIAAAYNRGELSTAIVRRIAIAHANPRVRAALIESEETVLKHGRRCRYHEFDHIVSNWERLADEDGTCDRNQRTHANRNTSLTQDFDGTWTLTGNFGSLQGAEINTVLQHFIDVEFRIDWDHAIAEHGDAAIPANLPRSAAQRRADALHKMAMAANLNGSGQPATTTNIVIDHITFARWIRKLAGTDPGPDNPWRPDHRCSTLDGVWLEPGETAAASLLTDIRRIVVDSAGVVIDMGRKSRLFTGHTRLATQIPNTTCIWPGCHVPTTRCHIDHSVPWSPRNGDDPGGGCTCPANGAPLCAKHNRHKQLGYRTARGPDGPWIITRPDGTQLE